MYFLSRDEIEQNLKDAGCNAEIIKDFFSCEDEKRVDRQKALLEEYRKTLLKRIHKEEKKISCLDYLIFQLEKKQYESSFGISETAERIEKQIRRLR